MRNLSSGTSLQGLRACMPTQSRGHGTQRGPRMAFFHATADDLLPVLLSVEARQPVVYTRMGRVNEPRAGHYLTARDLPTLFQPQPFESATGGPAYLVTEAGTEVIFRKVTDYGGRDSW